MTKLHRRRFIARGVVAGAAGLITARPIFGVQRDDRLGVGVVGLGPTGQALIRTLMDRKDCRIAACCDVDGDRLGKSLEVVRKNGACEGYGDLRKLLDEKSIDVLFVATPTHWNALAAIWAIQAGKDVYLEPPLSHTATEGRRILEAAATFGRVFRLGRDWRTHAEAEKVLAAVRDIQPKFVKIVYNGRSLASYPIAQITDAFNYDHWLGPAPNREMDRARLHGRWRWYWEYGTGVLGSVGAQPLDFVCQAIAGKAEGLTVNGSRASFERASVEAKAPVETPDTQQASYRWHDANDPVMVTWEHRAWMTQKGKSSLDLAFYGKGPTLLLNDDGLSQLDKGAEREARLVISAKSMLRNAVHKPSVDEFFDAVKARQGLSAKAVGALLQSNDLVHLGNIACQIRRDDGTSGDLAFDAAKLQFPGSAEATSLLTKPYREPYLLPESPRR